MPQDLIYKEKSTSLDGLMRLSGPGGVASLYMGLVGLNLHLYGKDKIAELNERHDVTSVAELRYVRDSFVRPLPRAQSTLGVAQDPELSNLELYAGAQYGGEYLSNLGVLFFMISVARRLKRT